MGKNLQYIQHSVMMFSAGRDVRAGTPVPLRVTLVTFMCGTQMRGCEGCRMKLHPHISYRNIMHKPTCCSHVEAEALGFIDRTKGVIVLRRASDHPSDRTSTECKRRSKALRHHCELIRASTPLADALEGCFRAPGGGSPRPSGGQRDHPPGCSSRKTPPGTRLRVSLS